MLDPWDSLSDSLKSTEVKDYHDRLLEKKLSLVVKRALDVLFSLLLLIILSPIMLLLIFLIKIDSKGPAIYQQIRVTKNDRDFKILKFRTMVIDADKVGSQVTTSHDERITKVGKTFRKFRLDELPQLVNILKGDMTFVGTRPEVRKYVDAYTKEMKATLLLPAGVTSLASIVYKDEQQLLDSSEDVDNVYTQEILPAKMHYNLEYLHKFSLLEDLKIVLKTIKEVFL